MKKVLLLVFALSVAAVVSGSAETPQEWRERRKQLAHKVFGKICVVNAFPDYKVRVDSSGPDIWVNVVYTEPSKPGQWQFVSAFPDYTIQFVDAFEDFSVGLK